MVRSKQLCLPFTEPGQCRNTGVVLSRGWTALAEFSWIHQQLCWIIIKDCTINMQDMTENKPDWNEGQPDSDNHKFDLWPVAVHRSIIINRAVSHHAPLWPPCVCFLWSKQRVHFIRPGRGELKSIPWLVQIENINSAFRTNVFFSLLSFVAESVAWKGKVRFRRRENETESVPLHVLYCVPVVFLQIKFPSSVQRRGEVLECKLRNINRWSTLVCVAFHIFCP